MEQSLTGNIDFLLTLDTTNGQHTFNATIINIEKEFRIYLYPDKTVSFNELVKQSRFWNDKIPYFLFGKNLIVENAQINGTEIELDLSRAKLITSQTIVSSKSNVFYFIIDTYQYRYTDMSVQSKASFYLSFPSNMLVDDFHLIEYGLNNEDNKSIPFESNIANIDFTILPNLTTNPYTAVIQYHIFDSVENVIEKNNTLLDLLSFYYGIPIETLSIIVKQNGYTYVIYKQPTYRLMQNSPKNMNLAYLNLYSFNDFAKGITADFSNIKALHTTINDYIRTIYLDDISAFLILYSILETLADTEPVYFEEKDIMKQVFDSLFESFIQGMRDANVGEDEKYSNGSPIFKAIKEKWYNDLPGMLIKKPREMNPIKKIIKDNSIDWKKLNRHFATVKKEETGIKDIKDLRNTIIHDRKNDYTELLDMKNINNDLSFAVCIILLRELGITNVNFNKNWDKLSIMN
ncbi:hypothetical protein [Phocaeicola plebeius]|jgi:hypothetical protein|uniref:hypothetical protein n=1 Tax=Phocaeicola plebeius TaxID=310297 RepID=UPI00402A044F